MQPWFIATETFTPQRGESWSNYITWSGLTQLDEGVSLDAMLCPTLLPDLRDEYWPHLVNEDSMLNFFTDLESIVIVDDVLGRNRAQRLVTIRLVPGFGPAT
jgi:hypothetical protein